jgi:K+-transporting ATPase ATPase C chain
MWSFLFPAIRTTILFTVVTGGLYPLAVTGASWALFPARARGSLVTRDGKAVGSTLIAQNFTKAEYFHPRPSAASYDASSSTGSNFGPTNQKLVDRVKASLAQYRQENPGYAGAVPADAVTASASGLDPDISPANARIQAARVARARHLDAEVVRSVVAEHTTARWLGFIGEPRVNVLQLNLALDDRFGKTASPESKAQSAKP